MKKIAVMFVGFIMLLSGCTTMGTPTYSQNGTITSMQIVETEERVASLGGAALGGVAGGVLGNQVGKGKGKTAMTVLGTVVGAGVGANVGSSMKRVQKADIMVQLDDGNIERFVLDPQGLAVGKRVNVSKYGDSINVSPAR